MKKRIIILSVLVFVGLSFWLLWPRGGTPHLGQPSAAVVDAPATAVPSANRSAPADVVTEAKDRVAFARDLMKKANKPIQFFGKVIDQDDNPIPGVKVTLEIRVSKELTPNMIQDVFDRPVLVTGADGRFALTDAKGALLGVHALEKAGYEPSEKAFRKSYWYWRDPSQVFHPDVERPEVFRMWKQAGAEKLVRKGIGHAIPYDGTPTRFDLIEGRPVPDGGDLRVTLVRNPEVIRWGQRNYEWTATIESLNGGLIVSNAEQMYLAPADGYQTRVVVRVASDDPEWTDRKDIFVYLKLRGGKYYGRGELNLMVGADRPTTPFGITTFVNPSGSRNLEYDPLQDVVPAARQKPDSPKP